MTVFTDTSTAGLLLFCCCNYCYHRYIPSATANKKQARHIFDGMEKGVAALQFLQRANNIGKVVISSPSRLLTGFRFNLRYSGPCSSAAIMIMMFYY